MRAGLVRGTIATRRFRAKIGALTLDESLLRGVAHPALVGGGEHVGGRALLDLQGQLLRAREVELHGQAGMRRLERPAQLPEGLGERGGGVDGERRRRGRRRAGPASSGQPEERQRELHEGVHARAAPFPIMTSVDLMTANRDSPTLRPSRSAELRVITATSSWSPMPIRTSAMSPSVCRAMIRPRS